MSAHDRLHLSIVALVFVVAFMALSLNSCDREAAVPPPASGGDVFIDLRDGNAYEQVTIGEQCWMSENLRYLPAVSPPSQISEQKPHYYVHGYTGTSVTTAKATAHYRNYGVLYNWPAALAACPPGWHLPSDEEWTRLVQYMMKEYGLVNDWVHVNGVGNALKSCRQIDSPLMDSCHTIEQPRWESIKTPQPERSSLSVNVGAHYGIDKVGFSALPGGRFAYGVFSELGFFGFWWSSTDYYSTRAWYRFMRHEFGDVTRFNFVKSAAFSVRCIRN